MLCGRDSWLKARDALTQLVADLSLEPMSQMFPEQTAFLTRIRSAQNSGCSRGARASAAAELAAARAEDAISREASHLLDCSMPAHANMCETISCNESSRVAMECTRSVQGCGQRSFV